MNRVRRPSLLKAYFAARLPLAALAGLRIGRLDGHACEVAVPFSWRTRNPFGSIYFAALSMAAELSCACLALMAARAPAERVSVFPIGLSGDFVKQAKADTTFTCTQGDVLFEAVRRAIETGEAVKVETETTGRTPDGIIVSSFRFTWSFKTKR
jgi:acyl-coenzyme A thioesterase PaaI-like protein